MTGADRPRVLCVDDEPHVLSALRRVLARAFEVEVAEGGVAALGRIASGGPVAVIVSDLRMPVIDGVTLLRRARDLQPDASRVLLTGHADLESAMRSVNEGALHSFLTKPCPADVLIPALQEAAADHAARLRDRGVLDETLSAAVRTLVDLLALANPRAFARAERITQAATAMFAANGLTHRWESGVTAMLSQIASISLPDDLLDRIHRGTATSDDDVRRLRAVPARGAEMVARIPRLEQVAEAIRHQLADFDGAGQTAGPRGHDLPVASRVLRICVDLDALQARGCTTADAVQIMQRRAGDYDPDLLGRLAEQTGVDDDGLRDIRIRDLRPGIRLEADLFDARGAMLIGRGVVLNDRLLHLLHNRLGPGSHDRVLVSTAHLVGEGGGRR